MFEEERFEDVLKSLRMRPGTEHPDTAQSLNSLEALYWQQGKYGQAEPLYQRALLICEKRLGPDHPATEVSRKAYAALLRLARVGKERG